MHDCTSSLCCWYALLLPTAHTWRFECYIYVHIYFITEIRRLTSTVSILTQHSNLHRMINHYNTHVLIIKSVSMSLRSWFDTSSMLCSHDVRSVLLSSVALTHGTTLLSKLYAKAQTQRTSTVKMNTAEWRTKVFRMWVSRSMITNILIWCVDFNKILSFRWWQNVRQQMITY